MQAPALTPVPVSTITVLPTSTTPEQTTKPVHSIFDGQVTQPPAELDVSVSIQKDPIYSNITVSFDGGKGQDLVQSMQVRSILSTGETADHQLGKKKGDEISIPGSRGSDQIQVAVTFMNGDSYFIIDKKLDPDRAGINTTSPTPGTPSHMSEGLSTDPVTEPPNSLSVSVDVTKDPIYRVITGTFRGGHGQSLVSKIEMKAALGIW